MTNRTEDLAYWINEREFMRQRKEEFGEQASPPFSKDPNMANVRYCNVHREDDKVTRWIAKNWRNPNWNDPNLTLAMVAARLINLPNTLNEIGYPYAPFEDWAEKSKVAMRGLMLGERQKVWTSAYTISTCGRRMAKEDYVFDHVLAQVASSDWPIRSTETLASFFQRLTQVDGLGSFLAAQVIADLKNTPGHPLAISDDWWTWSAPGPGSLRGLEAYFQRPSIISRYQKDIELCYNETMPLVGDHVGRIHMQDFQNCLCEFSKYIRVKDGDGRVRNKYPPG